MNGHEMITSYFFCFGQDNKLLNGKHIDILCYGRTRFFLLSYHAIMLYHYGLIIGQDNSIFLLAQSSLNNHEA